MAKGRELKQGESLALAYSWDEKDLTGFDCRVVVKAALADVVPLVDLTLTTLTEGNTVISGLMSKDTTILLPLGDLLLLAELSNDSTGEGKEFHEVLRIKAQGVF